MLLLRWWWWRMANNNILLLLLFLICRHCRIVASININPHSGSGSNYQRDLISNNCTCNHRKRVRIKQQQPQPRCLEENDLQFRGGGGDDMGDDDRFYNSTHNLLVRGDVVPNYDNVTNDDDSAIDNNCNAAYSAHVTASSSNNSVDKSIINTTSRGAMTNRLHGLLQRRSSRQDLTTTTETPVQNYPTRQNQPFEEQQQQQQQNHHRLVVEFDTQATMGNSDRFGNSIRNRIRSRIGNDNDWDRLRQRKIRGAALSISLDLSPNGSADCGAASSSSSTSSSSTTTTTLSTTLSNNNNNHQSNGVITPPNNNILPTPTIVNTILATYTILKHSALLLPRLLLSRRALNFTYNAIVDYFRGRTFRTTFTRMERAYLRYYEFPAAIRAGARLGSQITILLVWSVAVRWWMNMILAGGVVGPLVLGMSGMDRIGMVAMSSSSSVWNVGLPCYQRGRGMAWLCGLIWIGAVVGTGHACTVALSVWGGPLRLQAAADQAEKPKQILWRAIHHPIKWVRELEEWKHLPDLQLPNGSRTNGRQRGGRSRVFDPDPLLFPVTWLPLRWIQIFAVAKAFSTDPQHYRWCSPDNARVVIPKLMKQYLIQLALGDEWQRVFLGEKRVGLGILVVLSYFFALVWMVFTAFTLDGGAAAMLIPSLLAAIISGGINFVVFWNRLGTRSQKKALAAIGWA